MGVSPPRRPCLAPKTPAPKVVFTQKTLEA